MTQTQTPIQAMMKEGNLKDTRNINIVILIVTAVRMRAENVISIKGKSINIDIHQVVTDKSWTETVL